MTIDIDDLLHKQLDIIAEVDARSAAAEAEALAAILAVADEVTASASRVFGTDILVTPCAKRVAAPSELFPAVRRHATGADALVSDIEFVATLPLGDVMSTNADVLFSLRRRLGKWSALDATGELYDDVLSAARAVFARAASCERIVRRLRALKDAAH